MCAADYMLQKNECSGKACGWEVTSISDIWLMIEKHYPVAFQIQTGEYTNPLNLVLKSWSKYLRHLSSSEENQRGTLRHLHDNGPHFPDFDNPDLMREVAPGFIWAKPVRMLKRGNIYMVGSVSLQNMLTNAVYLGHWIFKDSIVQWNNHPAIISEDLFYQAFNYLSPYNIDGTLNEDYSPRLGRRHSSKKKIRNSYEPIYVGLVGSYHEGKWCNATASWRKSLGTHSYTCGYSDNADIQQYLWSRRADYFDRVINDMLHAKLKATFNPEVWEEVLDKAGNDFVTEERMLRHQLTSVQQKLKNLLDNFSYVQSKTLLQALEREFANNEQEKERLENKLASLQRRIG